MIEKQSYRSELYSILNRGNLNEYCHEFKSINKWFIEIIESLSESKTTVKDYQSDLESKFIRFGFTNQSILELINGSDYDLRGRKINIIDIFSIYSLCRSQFESFTMIYYLYWDNISELEKRFRYNIYKLHGLLSQSAFPVTFKRSEQIKKVILTEIEEIRRTLNEEKYNKFKRLVKNPQKPRRARYINTEQCFKIAKLNSGKLNKYWSLLSNHLHSEHIGDRQYNFFSVNRKDRETALALTVEICMLLTSRLIINLKNNFKGVEIYFNTIPFKTQVFIETLDDMSTRI